MSEDGFNVSSVDLPFTGLHDDAAFLSNVLDDADGEVILVGHSSFQSLVEDLSLKPMAGS